MIVRYIARAIRPLAWSDDHDGPTTQRPSITVHETDREAEPTWLLDAHGTPLYRLEERAPMGFCLTGDGL